MEGETASTLEAGHNKKRFKTFSVLVFLTVVLVGYSAWHVRLPMRTGPSLIPLISYENKLKMSLPKISTIVSNQNQTERKKLCFRFMGRLGNRMFQLAAVFGIARTKGMIPVIQKSNPLFKTFELTGITTLDYNLCHHLKIHRDRHSCAYDEDSVNFPSNKDMGLFGYFQSWRYFKDSFVEVRELFTFKAHLRILGQENLKKFIVDQHGEKNNSGTVFVGVHIRRGDIARTDRNKQHGYVVASVDYLHRAMDYFRERFRRVFFVVCSDDEMWPFLNLPHKDSVFITGQSSTLDMAILTLCNHSIMTVGSFGWWSAWLTNGITLYPSQQYRPGSRLAKQFNLTDYMPPHWIPIY